MLSIKRTDTISLLILSLTIGHVMFTLPTLLSLPLYQGILNLILSPSSFPILLLFGIITIAGILLIGIGVDKLENTMLLIQISNILIIVILVLNEVLLFVPIPIHFFLFFAIAFVMMFNIESSLMHEFNFISLGLKRRERIIGICILTILSGYGISAVIYFSIGVQGFLHGALIMQVLYVISLFILSKLKDEILVPEKLELGKRVFIYFTAWISILVFSILGTDIPSLYTDFLLLQFNVFDVLINTLLLIGGILISVLLGRRLSFTMPFMLFAVHILLYSITLTTPLTSVVLLFPMKILEMLTIGSIFPNVFLVFSYLKSKDRAKYFSIFICIVGFMAVISLIFLQPFLFQNPVITLFVLFLGIIPINFLLQSGVLTETETGETLNYLAEAKKLRKKMSG
ncbi:MAG: hypothetical protein ACXQS8_00895 [Candidatus Helarchaeales archaeon]